MNQSTKSSLLELLMGLPIRVSKSIDIYQPTVKDLATLGYEKFGALSSIWNITRADLVKEETDETWNLTDFEVWREAIIYNRDLQSVFKQSVLFFMHKTVEFLPVQRSIFIGELQSGVELSEELFSEIRIAINQVANQKENNEETNNAPRSKKAQEIADKIAAGKEKIKAIQKEQGIDPLAKQIAAFVAHSHKSFEEVFAMTLIQFQAALEKTVEIENYNISTLLSPYIDKKSKKGNKHWLE